MGATSNTSWPPYLRLIPTSSLVHTSLTPTIDYRAIAPPSSTPWLDEHEVDTWARTQRATIGWLVLRTVPRSLL